VKFCHIDTTSEQDEGIVSTLAWSVRYPDKQCDGGRLKELKLNFLHERYPYYIIEK